MFSIPVRYVTVGTHICSLRSQRDRREQQILYGPKPCVLVRSAYWIGQKAYVFIHHCSTVQTIYFWQINMRHVEFDTVRTHPNERALAAQASIWDALFLWKKNTCTSHLDGSLGTVTFRLKLSRFLRCLTVSRLAIVSCRVNSCSRRKGNRTLFVEVENDDGLKMSEAVWVVLALEVLYGVDKRPN